MFGNEKVDSF